jgi:hypothetical protein
MGIMSPARFTPEIECYTVLILQFFPKTDIKDRSVSDTFGTREAGQEPWKNSFKSKPLAST